MFKIGDYIAHPMHGAGIIEGIVSKKINGAERDYYVLKLPVGDMVVMVPVEGCENIGVRNIISGAEAKKVIDSFSELDICMTQNWKWSRGLCAAIMNAVFQQASEKCCIRQSRYLYPS